MMLSSLRLLICSSSSSSPVPSRTTASAIRAIGSITKLSSSLSSSTTTTTTTISSKQITHDQLPAETIYILDGTALLFHAYFSRQHNDGYKNVYLSKEYTTSNGIKSTKDNSNDNENDIACGALTVMAFNFARFIRNVKPKYVAVAFDANSDTFRKKLYPSYKAQRESPPDLLPLFSLAPKLLDSMGCRCFVQAGYEADDVMATLGKWSRERGLNVVHVSIDKDMLQLIDTGVHVMNPFTLDVQGPDEVIEKFGVPPESLIDLMTLMGDSADNIPGVKGIGPKIAAALIKHYGSVDNMCAKLGLSQMKKKDNVNVNIETVDSLQEQSQETINNTENDDDTTKKKKKKPKVDKDLEHIDAKQLEHALKQLEECLQPIKATPNTILKKLLACEYNDLTLFQHLFKLRCDIKIAGLHEDNGHSSRILNPIKDKYVDKTDIYPFEASSVEFDENAEQLSTFHFRYIGEKHGAEEEIRRMSESLMEPLELLRRQYHKLER